MSARCNFCYWNEMDKTPVNGWVEVIQGYMDYQPHPGRVDGLIECDRRVFEDDSWFCVVEREPLAEGHVRLYCKLHITNLSHLRGSTEEGLDPSEVDAARSNLLDDLLIAHDAVMRYDDRVVGAVVLGGTAPDAHLHFDIVPLYRFEQPSLQTLGERAAHWNDIPLTERRQYWTEHKGDFKEAAERLREAAGRIIHARPGRRRAGLLVGDEVASDK